MVSVRLSAPARATAANPLLQESSIDCCSSAERMRAVPRCQRTYLAVLMSVADFLFVCLSVPVSVCLYVREHIFQTRCPIFTKFYVHVTYGRDSVLLGQRRDTSCSFSMVNDMM